MASHSAYLTVSAMLLVLRYNMLTWILAVFIAFLDITESAPSAAARQQKYLPALPGYIPVYIRAGDTPLEEINPDLAEAFNSYGQKHGRLVYGRSNDIIGEKINVFVVQSGADDEEKEKNSPATDLDMLDIEDQHDNDVGGIIDGGQDGKPVDPSPQQQSQHIQKIPRSLAL